VAPPDAGERANDVLCIFDADPDGSGGVFALVLTRPTEWPAQPLAFGLFDCAGATAWWGGPTAEVFALAEVSTLLTWDHYSRPNGQPRSTSQPRRPFWLPGRDHAPSATKRLRVFTGSVCSTYISRIYRARGLLVRANADMLFDPSPKRSPIASEAQPPDPDQSLVPATRST